MSIKLHKLIKPELERLLKICNFTDEEKEVFEMLSKGCTITEISMEIGISDRSVSRRIRNIKEKIERV